jgi:hypothetical protein
MYGTKTWYQSTGVWGGVIAVLSPALAWFGYTLTADDAQALSEATTQIALLVGGATSAIGGVISIVGRVRASRRIGA